MQHTSTNRAQSGYRSYLLRVWHPNGGTTHATIEDVTTGRCQAFASLEDLRSWLEEEACRRPAERTGD